MVDGTGDELLAGAGFTGHQDRAGRARYGLQYLEELAHRSAPSDDSFEPIPLLELRPQIGVFRFEPPLLERRRQDVKEMVELKRFRDEVTGSPFDGFDRVLDGAIPGHHHAYDIWISVEGRLEDLGAINTRKTEVGDDHVERKIR